MLLSHLWHAPQDFGIGDALYPGAGILDKIVRILNCQCKRKLYHVNFLAIFYILLFFSLFLFFQKIHLPEKKISCIFQFLPRRVTGKNNI